MWDFINRKVNVKSFLVIMITFGFFTLIGILCFHTVPKDSQSIIYTLLGSVATAFGTIVAFKFGSSSGSTEKSETIKAALEKKDKE